MIPQKRSPEETGSGSEPKPKRRNETDNPLGFSHNNTHLPGLRWLFEQSHSFEDDVRQLPLLADQSSQPSTPRQSEVSRSASRTTTRQKKPLVGLVTDVAPDEVVCYGTISHINCQLLRSFVRVAADNVPSTAGNNLLLSLHFQKSRCLVGLPVVPGIAQMNTKSFHTLWELSQQELTHLDAYLPRSECLDLFTRRRGSRERNFQIQVNVQGPARFAEELGALLSEDSIFLQEPRWIESGVKYHNPHVLNFQGLETIDVWLRELALQPGDNQGSSVRGDWSAALDGLAQVRQSSRVTETHSLDGKLVEKTQLLPHQVNGLDFMCLRESRYLKDNNLRYFMRVETEGREPFFRHRITGIERSEPQQEPTGGIVADDMGLGKTLTAISLVVVSRERAMAFVEKQWREPKNTNALPHTRATLIIVPNAMIIDSWTGEIKRRILPGTLKVEVYHGQNRPRHFSAIQDADIVITTYGTITAEISKYRQVLTSMQWFRVILDEAHTIRSQRTSSFRAVMTLTAQHHWCLTGTPVSNKVEDLSALLTFCRVPLLEDKQCFQLHLTKVAHKSFKKACMALREALLPICLRRTKAILNIPQPRQTLRTITFAPTERERYDRLLQHIRSSLDSGVSGRSAKKATMLEAILRLRMFCDQGTFTSHDKPDGGHNFDPDEALALLQQADEAKCACCGSEISVLSQPETSLSAVLGTCYHLLCASCHDGARDMKGENSDSFACPACRGQTRRKGLVNSFGASCNINTAGHSSKLDAVVANLIDTKHGEKSIVFSFWRKTLDVMAVLCNEHGLRYARIDGKTPQQDRARALESFTADTNVSVLLMTFGTGALGLNLTAATRVHIVEPQWNPAVESQAIGRILRIGQEADTEIIRYVVADSVEEQIQTYQKRKIQLAAAGFSRKGEDHAEAELRLLSATFLRGK